MLVLANTVFQYMSKLLLSLLFSSEVLCLKACFLLTGCRESTKYGSPLYNNVWGCDHTWYCTYFIFCCAMLIQLFYTWTRHANNVRTKTLIVSNTTPLSDHIYIIVVLVLICNIYIFLNTFYCPPPPPVFWIINYHTGPFYHTHII